MLSKSPESCCTCQSASLASHRYCPDVKIYDGRMQVPSGLLPSWPVAGPAPRGAWPAQPPMTCAPAPLPVLPAGGAVPRHLPTLAQGYQQTSNCQLENYSIGQGISLHLLHDGNSNWDYLLWIIEDSQCNSANREL